MFANRLWQVQRCLHGSSDSLRRIAFPAALVSLGGVLVLYKHWQDPKGDPTKTFLALIVVQMLPLVFLEKQILSCPDPVSMLSRFGSKAEPAGWSPALAMARVPFIVGTWKGKGKVLPRGVEYLESSTFLLLKTEPATVINWQQFTKNAETQKPMHAENGFLKILPMPEEGDVKKAELMLSHPFSVNEYYKTAHFDFAQNIFECLADTEDCFQRGPSAGGKSASGSRRVYKLEDDRLIYDMYLRTDGSDEFVLLMHFCFLALRVCTWPLLEVGIGVCNLIGLVGVLAALFVGFDFRLSALMQQKDLLGLVLLGIGSAFLTEVVDYYNRQTLLESTIFTTANYIEILAFVPAVWMVHTTVKKGEDWSSITACRESQALAFFAFLVCFYVMEDLISAYRLGWSEPLGAAGHIVHFLLLLDFACFLLAHIYNPEKLSGSLLRWWGPKQNWV
ncbi:unnamed protein product [Durusdinium trenchii]|uniref:THAP4-like heme-binding domain-containing protein n=2 Tax=Durusdinium trenchii TaxID=1381693 RepID=A0ABP0MIP7_9DINO